MQIWVDADSVPQTLRTIILRRASTLDCQCVFAADRSLPDVERFIEEDTCSRRKAFDLLHPDCDAATRRSVKSKIRMQVVQTGSDSADTYIVENAPEGSLCITHDIPLASRLLPKGCIVIDDRGGTYSEDNIRQLLGDRAVNAELRSWGVFAQQQKKMGKDSAKAFSDNLDRTVTALRAKEAT